MKIKLKNNVRTTMASRGISSWSELTRRLNEKQGYQVSRTSITRMVEQDDPAYPLKLIEALCNEFSCLPNDLFYIEINGANPDELQSITNRRQPFEFGHITQSDGNTTPTETVATEAQRIKPVVNIKPDEDDIDELIGGKIRHLSARSLKNERN